MMVREKYISARVFGRDEHDSGADLMIFPKDDQL
jgi:hypothetical protein